MLRTVYEYGAQVLSVHDGDTLRLDVDLGFRQHYVGMDIRLAGVDAPELGRADHLGEQARDALDEWVASHPGPYRVTTTKDRQEKYGRFLVAALLAPDGHELLVDQAAAGWLKPYAGSGPKPSWP